jgi:S1-C subfamily serine protease
MTWNNDDYGEYDEFDNAYSEEPYSAKQLLIGALMGVLTLVLIAAMVFTTVGHFFLPDHTVNRSLARSNQPAAPSAEDLRNANYRASAWQASQLPQSITPTPISPEIVAEADAEYLLLTNIYERVNQSVVNIEISSSLYHDDLDIIDSSGSGFVLDMEGHIVTNAHVVRDAEEILVTFSDGYVTSAEIIGYDDYSDLAVIKVAPELAPLVPVELGDSNTLQVGQRVVAIGNPFGLEGSMTVGIVSALGRSLPSAELLDPTYQSYSNPSIIQVDASVNPGNSGGPLLDSYGRVIGINTAIRSESGVFQGIAFAVPVNTMKRVIPQLINPGYVEYSWLGISSLQTEGGYSVAALADELGFGVRYGILISGVSQNSPADHAGLRPGTEITVQNGVKIPIETTEVRGVGIPIDPDIIVAINGITVRDIDDLVAYLVENTSPGDRVVLTIVRGTETLDLDVTLGVRPQIP